MRKSPYELERLMGIEAYLTNGEGFGGRLRSSPADFVVEEVTSVGTGESGGFQVVRVRKDNWETHHLIRDMSRQLGISDERISIAGTKDKRAITTQMMSIYGISQDDLKKIALPRVEITPVGRTSRPVSLGDLKGNNFDIRISEIRIDKAATELGSGTISAEIAALGGVPNFFGYQRFGIRRPITHLIGEKLVQGDLEGAALDYIARSFPDESPENRDARDYVMETRDFRKGIDLYPLNLRYERAMMHRLIERPGDYAGAFRSLPGTLMKLFVSAYQSYLFNKMLSHRMLAGRSISAPDEGDTICFFGRGGTPDVSKTEKVTAGNRQDIAYLYKRKRVMLVLPLVGKKTNPGDIDEAGRQALDASGVTPGSFELPRIPELSSSGLWRPAILQAAPSLIFGEGWVKARFFLTSGSYATTVLREYMKANPRQME